MKLNLNNCLVYEDESIIVYNKPATLLSLPDQSTDISLLSIVEGHFDHKVYPVNRLDRPVSGLQLFAKSSKVQAELSREEIAKEYLAITEPNESLIIGQYSNFHIRNSKFRKAHISDLSHKKAKRVILDILNVIRLDHYNVALIQLISGRFHQIRAQLAHLNSPIKGDVKYGARRKNKDRSICLHSYKLTIKSLDVCITCTPPKDALWDIATEKVLFN